MGLQATLAPSLASHGALTLPPVYTGHGPLIIKNTFLEAERVRTESLECFFRERRVFSCPLDVVCEGGPIEVAKVETSLHGDESSPQDYLQLQQQQLQPLPKPRSSLPPPPSVPAPSAMALVGLAEQMSNNSNSSDLPSIGSMSHSTGACKPCAFFHKTGCANGRACTFCHLCGADALKRRKQERRQRLGEVLRRGREARPAVAAAQQVVA